MSNGLKLGLKAVRDFAVVRGSPHARALGIQLVETRKHEAWVKLPYDPRFIGNPQTGVIHGGVMTTLLDNVCATSVFAAIDTLKPVATLDLRIDYMRPATPGKDVIAHGSCYKVGKLIAFTRGIAYHDAPEEPIATAAAAFMFVGNRGKEAGTGLADTSRGADFDVAEKPERAAPEPEAVVETAPIEARSRDINVGRLQALLGEIPYARFIGLAIDRKGDELTTILPFARTLIGNPLKPALHGGVIGAFLEMTAILKLVADSTSVSLPKTIDINVDYLRSGRPADTYARAVVWRLGRRVANVRAEAWQEAHDKPIAALHGHFLVTPGDDTA
jgi:uncharacterized protein (TIGR00369 family)